MGMLQLPVARAARPRSPVLRVSDRTRSEVKSASDPLFSNTQRPQQESRSRVCETASGRWRFRGRLSVSSQLKPYFLSLAQSLHQDTDAIGATPMPRKEA